MANCNTLMRTMVLSYMFICASMNIQAQVQINEYSASNLNSFSDQFGRTEDWIELHNAGTEDVDISGWFISDKEANPTKWAIPEGTIISAQGFMVFSCSGRDGKIGNEYHTNFKLSQTSGKDMIVLADPTGNIIESYEMALTMVEHSRCKTTDGASEWKVCTEPSYGGSNNGTAQFDGYTATPEISLAAGYYSGPQVIEITNNQEDSQIRYTVDGTNPTLGSLIYEEPITISGTQVVKAQAFSNNPAILTGKMDFNTYFIDEDFSLAVFSVAADDVLELAGGQGELIPIGSIEYFNVDKERAATSFGSLNRHGQDSWVLDHRSLDWISRDEMGYSKAVDAPLFSYSDRDEYQKFMFRNSGDDNYPAIDDFDHEGSTHVRDEYVQTLAQLGGMELDLRAVERVILFLNGQYWGVYGMRERPVDHDYTDYYYDQGKYEIQYLSTWGSTEIEYGGQQAVDDWVNLRDFILQNEMSIPENYAIAEDSINMTSLIDYMLMNLNVVASDWLNYNTGWWRGLNPDERHKKWGYILWDLDATFDYYINYSGVPNISPNALPCDIEEIATFIDMFFGGGDPGEGEPVENPEACTTIINGTAPYPVTDSIFLEAIAIDSYCCETDWDDTCQNLYNTIEAGQDGTVDTNFDVGKHEKIYLKLIDESPEFKKLYYTRYADLMNTVFTCENMISVLDSMIATIEPEMPRQIDRWGGTMEEWMSNVEDLKDFINERCNLLDDGALECYEELSGPYAITLMAEPLGVGEIDFNSLDIESFPWSGSYFGGVENDIKAKVFSDYEDDYVFSHWVSSTGNEITPNVEERKANIFLTQADTLTAIFIETTAVDTDDLTSEHHVLLYPNPASSRLTLEFDLEVSDYVQVDIYSVTGQKIKSNNNFGSKMPAGEHIENLDISAIDVTGLYFIELQIGEKRERYKVNIVK